MYVCWSEYYSVHCPKMVADVALSAEPSRFFQVDFCWIGFPGAKCTAVGMIKTGIFCGGSRNLNLF